MLVNCNKILLDLDNMPIKDGDKEVTMGNAICVALNANFNDENIGHEEKMKRFTLMTKIYNKTEPVELSVEDCALIIRLCGKIWNPLILGRITEEIEKK